VRNKRNYNGPGILVDRTTKWGNPFIVSYAHEPSWNMSREESIQSYEKYLKSRPSLVSAAKSELRGHDLICWCSPLPCHADILIEIANSP